MQLHGWKDFSVKQNKKKKKTNKNTHKLPIVVKLNLYYATFNKSKMNYSTFTVKL